MADRGTSNASNTRNPNRPPSHPSRLDQFADDLHDQELSGGKSLAEELGVTSNDEARSLRRSQDNQRKNSRE